MIENPPPPILRSAVATSSHYGRLLQKEMSNRNRPAGPEARTTIVDSVIVELKLDYEQTKRLAEGQAVQSDIVSAGGHTWRIDCYPRGAKMSTRCRHLSIMVEHLSKPRCAKAIVEAFLMDKHGNPSVSVGNRSWTRQFVNGFNSMGWPWFVPHTSLLENYTVNGQITIICGIMVLPDSSIPVPPSNIRKHLGLLLDSTDGTDVSFNIDGETFHAHRALLAARSPVFRAELLGSMAEATMPSITLQDIAPTTFKVMLRFIYTDSLNVDELEDTPSEMMQDLLAAADRYALDRLKFICAQKLSDGVSVDTVALTLACAEMYDCQELKNRCMDFFAKEENFKKAVLTKGFVQLVQTFPSIIDELRERVGLF